MESEKRESTEKKYSLTWENLSLRTQEEIPILRNLNGCVESGDFLAIMGPSGAGKSSLLSILTARLRKNNTRLAIQGNTFLNGHHYSIGSFSKISAYVQQDDLLFGTLTVRETFLFQAKLKLWNLPPEEQQLKCDELIKKLNLSECANTLIGNSQFKKNISGGQKKRVSIGVQLISQPHILVFDEPTSGLDSHNALIIIKLLVELTQKEKKLIIATIHQPSSLIFQSMDKLYLLKGGECVYSGQANAVVGYMQKLGISVDFRMNPADFFMLEISSLKEQQGYVTPLNNQNHLRNQSLPIENQVEGGEEQETTEVKSQQASYGYQFRPLLERSFKNFIRLPSNQINKLVTALMIPALLGIIYYDIGNQAPEEFDQQYLMNLIAYWFMGVYFVFAMNIFDTTLAFPSEKELIFRDVAAGLYSLIMYYVARLLAEIVGCLLPSVICGVALYLLTGLDLEGGHFAVFMGLFVLMALCGYLFGLFFGVLVKNESAAINFLPMVVIPILLFGGLVVNIDDIPVYIRWLQYLSPIRHSVIILFQDQMSSSKFRQYAALDLPHRYGLGASSEVAWSCLLGLLLLYFSLSVLFLFIMKKTI